MRTSRWIGAGFTAGVGAMFGFGIWSPDADAASGAELTTSTVVSTALPAPHSIVAGPDVPIELTLVDAIDAAAFDPSHLDVFGRWSGVMEGEAIVLDGGRRIRFVPAEPFQHGEAVTAALEAGSRLANGGSMQTGFSWSFWVRPAAGKLDMIDRGERILLDDGETHVQPYGAYAGEGLFRLGGNYSSGQNVRGLCTMDLNHDGWPDIGTVNMAVGPDEVLLFLGDGEGNLSLHSRRTSGGRPWMIVTGDVNGDGNVDVMAANREGNNVSVLLGDGAGGLAAPATYATGNSPLAVDVGDLDGDGDLDLTGVDETDDKIFLLENPGR